MIEDKLIFSNTHELVSFLDGNQVSFRNKICKRILEGLRGDYESVHILTVYLTDQQSKALIGVSKEGYITTLETNFDGLLAFEEYELAAEAKQFIKKYKTL